MPQKPAKRPPPSPPSRPSLTLPRKRGRGGWGKGEGREGAPSRRMTKGVVSNDDTVITALELAGAELTPAMQAYFDKCTEKLGFVPNVLKAYAFDMAKLEAFVAMYNDLMLAPSGLTKLEREMIAEGKLGTVLYRRTHVQEARVFSRECKLMVVPPGPTPISGSAFFCHTP